MNTTMDKTLEALVAAAEKYAAKYDGDDRQDIKTDVLNAFYAGAQFATPARQAAEGGEADGCQCQRCGRRYKVDVLVPDATWLEISPKPVDGWRGGGLLCGPCIFQQLEKRGYAAYRLEDLSPPPSAAEADCPHHMDIFEAYMFWPEDIRKKLSMHDLRRMSGWAPAPSGEWGIDHSAGRPILVYERCSVIEDEQARYVLNLVRRDMNRSPSAAEGMVAVANITGADEYGPMLAWTRHWVELIGKDLFVKKES